MFSFIFTNLLKLIKFIFKAVMTAVVLLIDTDFNTENIKLIAWFRNILKKKPKAVKPEQALSQAPPVQSVQQIINKA